MQVSLYQTADAEHTLSDRGCRRHSIRHRLQETLYQTSVQEPLYQTAYAGDTLSDSVMQETLYQTADVGTHNQTADAGVSRSDSGCRSLH